MEEPEMDLMQALEYIARYNGHTDGLKEIRGHILKNKCLDSRKPVGYPEFLPGDPDTFLRVIWSILVCMYGDYGTSPRFGWIWQHDSAIAFLDKLIDEKEDEPNVHV